MYRILTREESDAYARTQNEEREQRRGGTDVIGQQMHEGVLLNVVGPRLRGPYGGMVKFPKRMVERQVPYWLAHVRHMYPMTRFEIQLHDIGAFVRRWEEVHPCLTCDATGTIPKNNPNHFHYWAQHKGVKCRACSGQGRVLRAYEDYLTRPREFVRRNSLLFRDADGVVHAVSKQGRVRSTRCRAFKGIPEMFLTGFGHASCLLCLVWTS